MRALFIGRLYDYIFSSSRSQEHYRAGYSRRGFLLAGFCIWVIQFIAHPTARTLLRVFVGLCLAAVVAYLVLASGYPISLLVS